jgi:predicted ATPase/DNA-binding CsgD family transcriptional regulator
VSSPKALTSFIGRYRETAEISQLLADPACRLLTLLGPGGSGKTRLALEVAAGSGRHFADGVVFVPLQAVSTPAFLITAIAEALEIAAPGRDDPQVQLLNHLAAKNLLLVLDNFEQLLDGAGLLSQILQQAAGVRLLVTSRAALYLQEEWLYPLSGLPYPPAEQAVADWPEVAAFDAVQLFVERARRVRPGFSPQAEQRHLLRICQLVEGMPLALELAAAWARSLDCATIVAEIERNLTFLTSPLRNVADRHRSMQAVFIHSWALLAPAEQETFPRLALFRGGFRREAAAAVAGATLPLLTALVDKSLLRWEANGRYQIHELLRQYAENQLHQSAAEETKTRQRPADYYLDFLHRRSDAMLGAHQLEAAVEIAAEMENIRAAWHWAVQHQMFAALDQAVEPLAMFCHLKSRYREAANLLEAALAAVPQAEVQQPVMVRLLSEMGWMAIRLGQFDKATRLFHECQAIYRQFDLRPLPGQATDPLLGLGTLASIGGDYAQAELLAEQARQTAVAHNQLSNLQTALYLLASTAYAQGRYEQAQTYAQSAYDVCRQTQDRWFMAYCLNEMGQAARALADYPAAQRHFEAGYALREQFSDWEGMALALNNLGDVAWHRQQYDEARDLFSRSVALYRQSNDKGGLATAVHGLAKTAAAQNQYDVARQQFRQALTMAAEIQFTSLLLAILAAVGYFLWQTGRVEAALSLLLLVAEHPAANQGTKTAVQQQLRHIRTAVSPALMPMTMAMTPPPDLETAVALAQTELNNPIPPLPEKPPAPVPASTLIDPLTERELEVLPLLAQGLTNRQIADRLTVVIGTVKAHNNSIYSKLGVSNRVQALTRARELGLIR